MNLIAYVYCSLLLLAALLPYIHTYIPTYIHTYIQKNIQTRDVLACWKHTYIKFTRAHSSRTYKSTYICLHSQTHSALSSCFDNGKLLNILFLIENTFNYLFFNLFLELSELFNKIGKSCENWEAFVIRIYKCAFISLSI